MPIFRPNEVNGETEQIVEPTYPGTPLTPASPVYNSIQGIPKANPTTGSSPGAAIAAYLRSRRPTPPQNPGPVMSLPAQAMGNPSPASPMSRPGGPDPRLLQALMQRKFFNRRPTS